MSSIKRLRSLSPSSNAAKRAKTANDAFTILSWNVDSPAPYLVASAPGSSSIGKYLVKKKGTSVSPTKAKAASSPVRQPTLREIFASHGWPDICCLQEVRALAKDTEMIRSLLASANTPDANDSSDSDDSQSGETKDAGPRYTAHFSLCQAKSGGKRFGVATYVSSNFKHQYTAREVDWDAEGRLMILEMKHLKLAIINVYALNGSDFPWRDPKTGIVKGTRNERKRDFNRLLMKECQSIHEKGYRIVAIGDWNITRTEQDCYPALRTQEPHALARKEFNEVFMPTLDMVDVYRELHPKGRAYSWFSPGNGYRVDYALAWRSMMPLVLAMEYRMEEKWRHKSDHAPMLLTVAHEVQAASGG